MNRTPIDWVKNPDGTPGYTWNPITGCLNGCPYCYAYKLANGRLRTRYLMNTNLALRDGFLPQEAINNPFYPRFWKDRIHKLPDSWYGAKGIFVCDMSDLFGVGIPEKWTRRILETISEGEYKRHRFYLLTKQPQNLPFWSPFPDNCWVGVSATSSRYFAEACGYLGDVQASVKYLSIEPYLGEIIGSEMDIMLMKMAGIGQVIIGAQTKPYKPPKVGWVEEIVDACDKAGIPVFLKDNLKMCLGGGLFDSKGKHTPIPFDNPLRQEMPEGR